MTWEYKIIKWGYSPPTNHWLTYHGDIIEELEGLTEQDALNALGKDGWELFRIDHAAYYFKKSK
jgi:hypothetical protein